MKLEWMGEYRILVEKMVKFGNIYAACYQKESSFATQSVFSPAQLQVMEYILENEEKNQSMVEIATRLGISPSAFSKNVKRMEEKGLLEKYHTAHNRKNIIIKASQQGKEVYQAYSRHALENIFAPVFQVLDTIPKEYINQFVRALDVWTDLSLQSQKQEEPEELIKI